MVISLLHRPRHLLDYANKPGFLSLGSNAAISLVAGVSFALVGNLLRDAMLATKLKTPNFIVHLATVWITFPLFPSS